MDLQCPSHKEFCPNWNPGLVLACITSPPFELIMKSSFWNFMLKTVFLFKLPSGAGTRFMPYPVIGSAIVSGLIVDWLP